MEYLKQIIKKMIEYINPDITTTELAKEINSFCTKKVQESNGLLSYWIHYFLDYPWIVKQLKEMLGDLKGKKILDAGCGKSVLQFYLIEQGADVYSCDVNDYTEQLNQCDQRIKFKHCNFNDEFKFFNYEESFFDAIICVSVLEHMLPCAAQRACKNFAKCLTRDGCLILTTNMARSLQFTDNYIAYDKEYVNKIFINDELELVKKNFKDLDFHYSWFIQNKTYCLNNTTPLEFLSGGITLKKVKKND